MIAVLALPTPSAYAKLLDEGDNNEGVDVERGNGSGDEAFSLLTLMVSSVEEAFSDAAEVVDDMTEFASLGSASSWPKDPMAGLGLVQNETYCGWASLSSPLDPGDPAWGGNSAADGEVKWKSCAILGPGTPDAPGNLEGRPVELQFFPNAVLAAAAVPPPPDPRVIAERAIRQLQVPAPHISAGPDKAKLAVNLWTWLWIDSPGPLTATAAAGGVSVTATATLDSTTWSLGEPVATGGPYESGPPVTITCQGTGTAPPVGYDWKAQPPCGHKYTWMSAKDRTGGSGKWPITATSNWNVTWQSNTGVSGSTVLNASSTEALEIGEYRTVLVQGPGG
ncbi:hypothetical protein [Nakamurella sp.]|uniref:hypothetical protein n=1 Tax=Nakamurella sp. TaxID=1869182 RepID=UPI00378402F8